MDAQEKARLREEIIVVELSEDDYPEISQLISGMGAFTETELRLRDLSADYYRWMYRANPEGEALVVGARHEGRLVACFAIAPKRLRVPSGEVVVGKTMEIFTHPDYQGLGLMSRTASAAFEAAARRGLDHIFVTPSAMSYPIFMKKFGYREDFEVAYRVRFLRPGKLIQWKVAIPAVGAFLGRVTDGVAAAVQRLRPVALPPGYTLEEENSFAEPEESLWRRVESDYGVAIVRSARYLTWRYVEHPDSYVTLKLKRHGDLVGFIVLKETLRRSMLVGEIVDYVCPRSDSTAFKALISGAIGYFQERSAVMCEAWVIEGSRQEREFIKAGLRHRRVSLKFILSPGFPVPLPADNDRWMLAQGDGNDI